MLSFTGLPGEIRNCIYDEVLSLRDAAVESHLLTNQERHISPCNRQTEQSVVFEVTVTLQLSSNSIFRTGPFTCRLKFKLFVGNSKPVLCKIDPLLYRRCDVFFVSQQVRREAFARVYVPVLSRNHITLRESSPLSLLVNCLPSFVSSLGMSFHLLTPSGVTGPEWHAVKERCFGRTAAKLKSLPRLRYLYVNLGIDDCKNQDVVKPLLEKALGPETFWSPKIEVKLVFCTMCRDTNTLHFKSRNWSTWKVEKGTNEWTTVRQEALMQKVLRTNFR